MSVEDQIVIFDKNSRLIYSSKRARIDYIGDEKFTITDLTVPTDPYYYPRQNLGGSSAIVCPAIDMKAVELLKNDPEEYFARNGEEK